MNKNIKKFFEKFSAKVTKATGKPMAFILAVVVIIGWAITGPIFHYSDTWQLVINTGTTIITFLMVFVIQQSQNKDTMALQIKAFSRIHFMAASCQLISQLLTSPPSDGFLAFPDSLVFWIKLLQPMQYVWPLSPRFLHHQSIY